MNERRVVQIAVGLTAALVIFILGFSLGRNPERDGLVLVSSILAASEPASVSANESDSAESIESDITSDTSDSSSSSEASIFPINLNTATAEELDTVPGIGEVIAGRILAYRDSVGQFQTVDELLNVKGIGEKKLEEMREYLTVADNEN